MSLDDLNIFILWGQNSLIWEKYFLLERTTRGWEFFVKPTRFSTMRLSLEFYGVLEGYITLQ